MSHPPTSWQRSHPQARTDRLPALPTTPTPASARPVLSHAGRAPITWRLPRVRRVILRDPIDQAAADTLDAYLRHGAVPGAGVALANTIIGARHLSQRGVVAVDRAVAEGLTQQLRRLRPAVARADQLLAANASRCARCTAAEVCATHQHVLEKWWDLRDQAAVDLVNAVVAAMSAARTLQATTQPTTRTAAQPAGAPRATRGRS